MDCLSFLPIDDDVEHFISVGYSSGVACAATSGASWALFHTGVLAGYHWDDAQQIDIL